ncbi:MAG: hypothetical protein JW806_10625, partial [Sedimentisphaerales bacterium]|nr:hypothetical protein [Sedimentisphaerales bacterium]
MTTPNSSKICIYLTAFIAISLLLTCGLAQAACDDFVIDGTYEASLDLPRILFLLKRAPNEPPIEVEGYFELNYAFLDTGASGILVSKETAEYMELAIEPNAVFVDTGVAGDEYFDVSESLYIGTADYYTPDPNDPNTYSLNGPFRFQVKQDYVEWPEEPLDIIGMPAMAGKTAVFTPISDINDILDLNYYSADIKEANDPNIPQTDFQVALRFEKFINLSIPQNIPPLPTLAYNPMIDNIVVEYSNGSSSTGSWLFDTGGTVSIMSIDQAVTLGLTDANGEPIVSPDFSMLIGGIGGGVEIPGFILDRLSVPTLNGFDLVFLNARVCVHDIVIFDEDLNDFVVLDGVFGDNFTCASMDLATWDISGSPFDHLYSSHLNFSVFKRLERENFRSAVFAIPA